MQQTETQKLGRGAALFDLSALALHLLAMALMLCDHLWATVVAGNDWLTWLGRIAFPIFAFLIAEGYHHTSDYKKYRKRLLIGALLSEIPFNLMYSGLFFYPFHQNVLWTFLLALLCLRRIDAFLQKERLWQRVLGVGGVALLGYVAGYLTMADYYSAGVLTVILFHLCRGRKWWQMLGQFAGLFYLNWVLLGSQVVPVTLGGLSFEFPQQGMALLALVPIWLYRGRQGPHNRTIQYACYLFYPAHMLALALISSLR